LSTVTNWSFEQSQDKHDHTLKLYKKALRYSLRNIGDKHPNTAMVAKHLAAYYQDREMMTELRKMLEKREELMRLTLSNYDELLAQCLVATCQC
jgi:hypothetical protein